MADRLPGPLSSRGATHAWLALVLALGLPAACLPVVPLDQPLNLWPTWAQSLALQPERGLQQAPWVWWTAAWLHGSTAHLLRNLLALTALGIWGLACRPSWTLPAQLALLWPLTQIGLIHQALETYIGLSGVLHGCAILISLHQLTNCPRRLDKILGFSLLAGVTFKILMENPWQHVLIRPAGSDINVAPWAHLSGAVLAALIHLLISLPRYLKPVKTLT